MASINRVGSPMDVCEENYDLNQEVLDNKRKFLENKQRNRSRILLECIYHQPFLYILFAKPLLSIFLTLTRWFTKTSKITFAEPIHIACSSIMFSIALIKSVFNSPYDRHTRLTNLLFYND